MGDQTVGAENRINDRVIGGMTSIMICFFFLSFKLKHIESKAHKPSLVVHSTGSVHSDGVPLYSEPDPGTTNDLTLTW